MVDIHCHILPGFDDGARDITDTLEMAAMAQASGVKVIVATPHCNVPGEPDNYYDERYREAFRSACKALEEERIPIRLLPGMEAFTTFDLPQLVLEKKVLTINQSGYLLMEFAFDEDPEFVEIMVDRIKEINIKPIIAHPERYEFIKDDLEFARYLVKKGCIFQANKGSLLGRYGTRAKETVYELMKSNLVSVVASDAHSAVVRTPDMRRARTAAKEYCDVKKLFEDNPMKICTNRPLEK